MSPEEAKLLAKARLRLKQRKAQVKDDYEKLPVPSKIMRAGSDVLDLVLHGATAGFGTKAKAGVRSLVTGETYDDALSATNQRLDDSRTRAGSAGDMAELSGAVATPVAAAKAGATLLGRGANPALALALEGSAYGGAHAAGNDEDVLKGIATGGTIGGAVGAGNRIVKSIITKFANSGSTPEKVRLFKSIVEGAKLDAGSSDTGFGVAIRARLREVADNAATYGLDANDVKTIEQIIKGNFVERPFRHSGALLEMVTKPVATAVTRNRVGNAAAKAALEAAATDPLADVANKGADDMARVLMNASIARGYKQ